MKLLRRLLFVVVAVVAVWSALWWGASLWVERTFDEQVARLAAQGTRVTCGGRDVAGYPFALRLRCAPATLDGGGADVALAGLASGMSLSAPRTLRAAPVGPAKARLASGDTVEARWSAMDVAVDDLFSDRALEGTFDDLAVDAPFGALTVETGSFRAAPTPPDGPVRDDLRLVTTQRGIALAPDAARGLPGVDVPGFAADIVLTGAYEALARRGERPRDFLRRGFAGRVERLSLATGGDGLLLVSGPFSVDAQGRPSGRITIGVRNAPAVAAFLEGLAGEEAGLVVTALEGLGQDRTIDGEKVRALKVTVADGRIPVGFFSFDLPRLWAAQGS